MYKILLILTMIFAGPILADAAPACQSGWEATDVACYTSVDTRWDTTWSTEKTCTVSCHDTTECRKLPTRLFYGGNNCGRCGAGYSCSIHVWCSDSCHPEYGQIGTQYCTNNGGCPSCPTSTYTTGSSGGSKGGSLTYTCHYKKVSEWSDCSAGFQTATDFEWSTVEQSTECDSDTLATRQTCAMCGEEKCKSTTEAPADDLCAASNVASVPSFNAGENEWSWTCAADDGSVDCSTPCDIDGKCAMNNPGAQGEYAWNATAFRGDLCDGGTPTISSDFDTVLPMPDTEENPATVSWGCNHIGVGVSTAATACSASRLAPKPGVCGVDDGGSFSEESDINQQCCNPNSNPPCTNDDTFASIISQNGKEWSWTCNGSRNNGTDSVSCDATCIPEIDVDVSPNPFPLTSDGVTVEVTVTKTGACAGAYTCTVDGQSPDANNKITLDNVTSARDVVVICDGVEAYREHISGYCTARECNAQGTCQATPVISSYLGDNRCSSTCSSNADCTTGRIIETRP